jgi:hypothetical protein
VFRQRTTGCAWCRWRIRVWLCTAVPGRHQTKQTQGTTQRDHPRKAFAFPHTNRLGGRTAQGQLSLCSSTRMSRHSAQFRVRKQSCVDANRLEMNASTHLHACNPISQQRFTPLARVQTRLRNSCDDGCVDATRTSTVGGRGCVNTRHFAKGVPTHLRRRKRNAEAVRRRFASPQHTSRNPHVTHPARARTPGDVGEHITTSNGSGAHQLHCLATRPRYPPSVIVRV